MPHRPLSVALFIASIGNPGAQYAQTYHSAGHSVLSILQQRLKLPSFKPSPTGGQTTRHPELPWTLWKSPSFMNLSGPSVLKAWDEWINRTTSHQTDSKRLIVLHDELEKEIGWVGIKSGWSSARGHRGIQSIQSRIPHEVDWLRLGIGIGRPDSRTKSDVSEYVLQKMSTSTLKKLENRTDTVLEKLMDISRS